MVFLSERVHSSRTRLFLLAFESAARLGRSEAELNEGRPSPSLSLFRPSYSLAQNPTSQLQSYDHFIHTHTHGHGFWHARLLPHDREAQGEHPAGPSQPSAPALARSARRAFRAGPGLTYGLNVADEQAHWMGQRRSQAARVDR